MVRVTVVGAGPGGCWVTRRLVEAGHEVSLIVPSERHLERVDVGPLEVLVGEGPGGGAVYSMGNLEFHGPDCLEGAFRSVIEDISTPVSETPDWVLSGLDLEVEEAAAEVAERRELGISRTFKAVDFSSCDGCGRCLECPRGAKWDPWVDVPEGVDVVEGRVESVDPEGVAVLEDGDVVRGDRLVLAAGAFGSYDLLRRAGLVGDSGFFVDPYVHVVSDSRWEPSIQMGWKLVGDGFNVYPHATSGARGRYCLMVKVADGVSGSVGSRRKLLEGETVRRIAEGVAVAVEVLREAGLGVEGVVGPAAAHPGGSLASFVEGFRVPSTNVWVSDSSVLDRAPGAPPIGWILAVAEEVSRAVCC